MAWRLLTLKFRPSFKDELFALMGTLAMLLVAGCSCLNGNKGINPGAVANAEKSKTVPGNPQAEVGLPGVIETAKASEAAPKFDQAVGQASYTPVIDNPELQQKFNNLQNRFQNRVDQAQSQAGQSIQSAQELARKNIQQTETTLKNQAGQLQNRASAEAGKAQSQAQRAYQPLQTQAQQKVVAPIQQSAGKVGNSINQTAKSASDAASKATQATGRFFDSLLPGSKP